MKFDENLLQQEKIWLNQSTICVFLSSFSLNTALPPKHKTTLKNSQTLYSDSIIPTLTFSKIISITFLLYNAVFSIYKYQ